MLSIFAYIDPGSGSLFIQALIGGIAGIVFVARNFFRHTILRITDILKGKNTSVEAKKAED